MRLHKSIMAFVLILLALSVITGCGSKTQVKYVAPTGYAVIEAAPNNDKTEPVNVKITDSDDDSDDGDTGSSGSGSNPDDRGTSTYVDDSGNVFVADYTTVVSPSGEQVMGSYTPEEADINAIQTKLCSLNDVILGYVGCYYNGERTEATVTLKDTGRGDVAEMWFYVVFSDRTVHMKSEGFGVGNMNDYHLQLSDWEKQYGGKIQRILITPVIMDGSKLFACNNRQLLLIHKDSCRDVKS